MALMAVSYTHLDVYKRQILCLTLIRYSVTSLPLLILRPNRTLTLKEKQKYTMCLMHITQRADLLSILATSHASPAAVRFRELIFPRLR